MIKTFVLDTNVLLHSAQSIDSFQDNNVVIPMAVIAAILVFVAVQMVEAEHFFRFFRFDKTIFFIWTNPCTGPVEARCALS